MWNCSELQKNSFVFILKLASRTGNQESDSLSPTWKRSILLAVEMYIFQICRPSKFPSSLKEKIFGPLPALTLNITYKTLGFSPKELSKTMQVFILWEVYKYVRTKMCEEFIQVQTFMTGIVYQSKCRLRWWKEVDGRNSTILCTFPIALIQHKFENSWKSKANQDMANFPITLLKGKKAHRKRKMIFNIFPWKIHQSWKLRSFKNNC